MWLTTLSGQLPIVALVGHYPTNKLIGRGLIIELQHRSAILSLASLVKSQSYPVLATLSSCCPRLKGKLPTRYSPFRHFPHSRSYDSRSACMPNPRRQRSS